MIDEIQAKRLAVEHINIDSRGYSFRVLGVNKNLPRDWTVVIQAIGPDSAVLTGSIVLVVDEDTGNVRTLDDALASGWRAQRP